MRKDAETQQTWAGRVNEAFGNDIDPDQNAAVLLTQALGPRPEGMELPDAYYRLLGTVRPPEDGHDFAAFGEGLTGAAKTNAIDDFSKAMSRPWTEDEFPEVKKWLDRNRAPMKLVRQAVQRPEYFTPLVPPTGEDGQPLGMIQTLLPHVQEMRSMGRYTLCQAYLDMGAKRWMSAWENLQICHRLGRLTSRGPTVIDYLVGVALSSMAIQTQQQLLAEAGFDSVQLQRIAADLAALPAPGDPARAVNLTERMMFMDTVDLVADGQTENLETLGLEVGPSGPVRNVLFALVDWNIVKQRGTIAYDRLENVARSHDGFSRVTALKDSISSGPSLHRGSARDWLLEFLRQGSVRGVASAAVGDVFVDLMLPSLAQVELARLRFEQRELVLRAGVAVLQYRASSGRLPQSAEQLAPEFLSAVPQDVFAGVPLKLEATDKGFRLYSIGENQKDDDGKTFGDRPGADDLVFQQPAVFE
ncbi:MAG: hypothetical protein NXI04_28450 [Planctomycetaceae bacterium]|nr:hypothetical protein [Planctomycetaceae bacterium]